VAGVTPMVLLAGAGVMLTMSGVMLGVAGVAGLGTSRPTHRRRALVVRRSWLAGAALWLLVLVVSGWVAVAAGAAEFGRFFRAEVQKWGKVVRDAKMRIE